MKSKFHLVAEIEEQKLEIKELQNEIKKLKQNPSKQIL